MLRTLINNLPAFVEFEGCTFQLVILFKENKTTQLAYILTDSAKDSTHWVRWASLKSWTNPFFKESKALIIREGITTEQECRLAAFEIKKFLEKYLAKSLAEQKEIVP